ncbi:MAG: phosphate propanoyltransferase [Candidatus Marinimicrobia bacterium]|nr:phosphate propanoyltransferase [Candidatus Neomarinimicrobiota bacterium]
MKNKVLIEISARHLHLRQEDLDKLFGEGYELTKFKDLSQVGQFAAEETVKIVGPKAELDEVRLIGPCRKYNQVEISKTDGYKIGVVPPVRTSSDIEGTPGVKIVGPAGEIDLEKGLICARRHIHISPAEAEEFGVKHLQKVSVKIFGERDMTFNDVVVRVDPDFRLSFQVDTDEGNAASVKSGDFGELII